MHVNQMAATISSLILPSCCFGAKQALSCSIVLAWHMPRASFVISFPGKFRSISALWLWVKTLVTSEPQIADKLMFI